MTIKTLHGNAMIIQNKGVLILGDAGIGKSELCLELLYQNEKLIADDAVEIKTIQQTAYLSCPDKTFKKLHIKDLGVIDCEKIFSPTQFIKSHPLDFVVQLELPHNKSSSNNLLKPNLDTYSIGHGATVPRYTVTNCKARALAALLKTICYL